MLLSSHVSKWQMHHAEEKWEETTSKINKVKRHGKGELKEIVSLL